MGIRIGWIFKLMLLGLSICVSTSLFFVCIAACHGVISRSVSMTGGTGPEEKKKKRGEGRGGDEMREGEGRGGEV